MIANSTQASAGRLFVTAAHPTSEECPCRAADHDVVPVRRFRDQRVDHHVEHNPAIAISAVKTFAAKVNKGRNRRRHKSERKRWVEVMSWVTVGRLASAYRAFDVAIVTM